jgi:hypothetical protein
MISTGRARGRAACVRPGWRRPGTPRSGSSRSARGPGVLALHLGGLGAVLPNSVSSTTSTAGFPSSSATQWRRSHAAGRDPSPRGQQPLHRVRGPGPGGLRDRPAPDRGAVRCAPPARGRAPRASPGACSRRGRRRGGWRFSWPSARSPSCRRWSAPVATRARGRRGGGCGPGAAAGFVLLVGPLLAEQAAQAPAYLQATQDRGTLIGSLDARYGLQEYLTGEQAFTAGRCSRRSAPRWSWLCSPSTSWPTCPASGAPPTDSSPPRDARAPCSWATRSRSGWAATSWATCWCR